MTPNRVMIVIAAMVGIGLLIHGTGIYGNWTLVSNTGGDGNESCPGTLELARSLDPHIGGEIAAFQIAERTKYVGGETFNDKDGNAVSLADWKGRTVLLNLWATWCAPCRREMPSLQALEVAEGGDKFQVVPVSVDLGSDEKPKKFYADIGLEKLPFFADGTMGLFNNLKKEGFAFGMPSSLLLDGNSCVLGVLNGPAEWASDDATALIRAAKG